MAQTISQRIALEGAEEILKQLADLGQAGEKAVKQIQEATASTAQAGGLTGLSAVAENVRIAFARVGEAVAPVKTALTELEKAASEVGTRITEVASLFGVGLAAGIAGGIAGIFELIKASAESAHQLEVQSEVLGISVLDLKTFGAAAAAAGVDSDRLVTALTRFSQNVGRQNEQLFQDAAKLLEMLPAAASQAGVAIVQGIMPVGTAIKTHIISNIQDTIPQIDMLVEVLRRALSDQGIMVPATFFDAVRQNLLNTATSATEAGLKIRELAAQLGVNLPAQSILEQIQRGAAAAKTPLLELGITFGDLQKLSITDIILKAVDSLEKIQSPTERARLSLALFGRTWPEVLKALKDGSDGFELLREKVAANNPDLDANVAKLSESEKALIGVQLAGVGLRNQLAAIFAPAITSAAEGFTKLIKDNADTFKAWATAISDLILPGIRNLTGQLGETAKAGGAAAQSLPGVVSGRTGSGAAQLPGMPGAATVPASLNAEPLNAVSAKLDEIRQKWATLATVATTALSAINIALTPLTFAINAVFGTDLNNAGTAAVLFGARAVGAFGLASAAVRTLIALGGAILELFGLGAAGAALPLIGAVILLGTVIANNRDRITTALSQIQTALSDFLQLNIGDRINALFANVSFEPFRQAFISVLDSIRTNLDSFLQNISDFFEVTLPGLVARAAGALKSLLPGGGGGGEGGTFTSDQVQTDVNNPGGLGVDSGAGLMATGGRVLGFPGQPVGTDTIPAWLTPGEFVVRMQAVQHYGSDFFHALNNMHLPFDMLRGFSLGGLVDGIAASFTPPAPVMLAGGGPVLAAAGGAMNSLTLNLAGESFQLDVSPGHVYDKLARHARSSALRSAGRKPSWFSG